MAISVSIRTTSASSVLLLVLLVIGIGIAVSIRTTSASSVLLIDCPDWSGMVVVSIRTTSASSVLRRGGQLLRRKSQCFHPHDICVECAATGAHTNLQSEEVSIRTTSVVSRPNEATDLRRNAASRR